MYPQRSKLLLALLLLLSAPVCLAERADRDKPVHMEADQVLMDDAQHISTFIGNVQFTQGTMLIRGDKIVVVEDNEGFKNGTAYANNASFRQNREGLAEYAGIRQSIPDRPPYAPAGRGRRARQGKPARQVTATMPAAVYFFVGTCSLLT